jgi:uncharacterized protein
MHVAQLWRFPVKSMGGEQLETAELGLDGVTGDRVVHVQGPRGVVTSRTRPRLLGLHARLGPDGEPLVDGRPWGSPEVAADVRAAAGDEARLVRYDGLERFDVLPLLVATDGAIAAFGRDGRRLRPNLVVGGVNGLGEREWPGRRLRIGEVVVGLDSLRSRCVMTTFDPDTLEQDADVLRDINRRFGGQIALNAAVLAPGTIRRGDAVELVG